MKKKFCKENANYKIEGKLLNDLEFLFNYISDYLLDDDGEILLTDVHKKLLHWWETYSEIDWQNRELE